MWAVKKRRILKFLYIFAGLVLLIAFYACFSHGYGQSLGFQEYKPSVLPAGLHTTGGEFYVLRNKSFLPSFDKHINVNLNIPNSWLAEWKSDGHLTNPCSDFPDETDCHNFVSTKGQHYQLSGGPISEQPGSYAYDLRFIKNSTEIWITVSPKQNITPGTWNSVVDSFQPGHYSELKEIYGSSSGP